MSGKLTAIYYGDKKMPLSPYVADYVAYDTKGAFVFQVNVIERAALSDNFNEFLVQFPDEHCAVILSLPKGNYTMNVSIDGTPLKPIVVFEFQNNNTGEVYPCICMDNAKFVEEFDRNAIGKSGVELEIFEMSWSTEYLKMLFSGHIEGSEEFWTKFTGDLDVALMPVNLQMTMIQQGSPYKPVIVDKSQATFEQGH